MKAGKDNWIEQFISIDTDLHELISAELDYFYQRVTGEDYDSRLQQYQF